MVRVDAPVPLHVVQTLVEHGINVTHLGRLSDEQGNEEQRNGGDPMASDGG